MKNLTKIDKFYWALAVVLLMLSLIVIITLRGTFDAMNTANTIDPKSLENENVRVDQAKLEEAKNLLEDREFIPLDLR